MNKKTVELMWSICLMIMGVSGLIISVSRIAGAELPDVVQRVIGVISLVSLAAFGFLSALRFKVR